MKKILLYVFYCLLIAINTNKTFASHRTHCDLNFGYWFYCDDSMVVNDTKQNDNRNKLKKERDYVAELEALKKEEEQKRAKATLEPTKENIQEFMEFQKAHLGRSSIFSQKWKEVIWENPDLDYTLKHPTNTLAKYEYLDKKREDIKSSLSSLNDRYGLFFIYKSTCPYCHKYSGIIKEFSKMYGVDIIPITLDGNVLDEWKDNTITDVSVVQKLGINISQVPATILYDMKNKKILPVGYGMLSISDLEERIYILTNPDKYERF